MDARPTIFIAGQPFTVIGIIEHVQRRSDLLDAVIIPNGAAHDLFALTAPDELDVRTRWARLSRSAVRRPWRSNPTIPDRCQSTPRRYQGVWVPPCVRTSRCSSRSGCWRWWSAGPASQNVTLLSVMERTGEIGLRRAPGARRRQIAGQFLTESGMIGLIGGLVGAALGIPAVLVVSLIRSWTPVLDSTVALSAPLLGAGIGLFVNESAQSRTGPQVCGDVADDRDRQPVVDELFR